MDQLKSLIDYLIKEARKQSMSEDFQSGYEHAIWKIGEFGGFDAFPIHNKIGDRDVMKRFSDPKKKK